MARVHGRLAGRDGRSQLGTVEPAEPEPTQAPAEQSFGAGFCAAVWCRAKGRRFTGGLEVLTQEVLSRDQPSGVPEKRAPQLSVEREQFSGDECGTLASKNLRHGPACQVGIDRVIEDQPHIAAWDLRRAPNARARLDILECSQVGDLSVQDAEHRQRVVTRPLVERENLGGDGFAPGVDVFFDAHRSADQRGHVIFLIPHRQDDRDLRHALRRDIRSQLVVQPGAADLEGLLGAISLGGWTTQGAHPHLGATILVARCEILPRNPATGRSDGRDLYR